MHAPLAVVVDEPVMSPPSTSGLLQMIEQIDQKHEAAHKRLRESVIELHEQHENLLASVTSLRDFAKENANQIARIADTPPNVETVIMTPRVMIGIVIFAVTIAGGIWSSTSGLRSDVRDILTRMEAQKTTLEASDKMQEVQLAALAKAVDDMKRRQELQQYEIQGFKELIITGKARSK